MTRQAPSPGTKKRRMGGYLMTRLGLGSHNPAGAFRSLRFLGKNLPLVDLRQRPGLKDSFGPVDRTDGQDLFRQHQKEARLNDQDLQKIARNYTRNGAVLGAATCGAILGSLMTVLTGQGLLAFSLAVVAPVLLVLAFQNFLRAAQVRARRYMSGLAYLKGIRTKNRFRY